MYIYNLLNVKSVTTRTYRRSYYSNRSSCEWITLWISKNLENIHSAKVYNEKHCLISTHFYVTFIRFDLNIEVFLFFFQSLWLWFWYFSVESNGTYTKMLMILLLRYSPFHVHMYMYLSFLFLLHVCCHSPIQVYCQLILCSSSSQSFCMLEAFYVAILFILYYSYNVEWNSINSYNFIRVGRSLCTFRFELNEM